MENYDATSSMVLPRRKSGRKEIYLSRTTYHTIFHNNRAKKQRKVLAGSHNFKWKSGALDLEKINALIQSPFTWN